MPYTTTVYVDVDEWYPVWSARIATVGGRVPYGDPLEVDLHTAERWKRVFDEFDQVQNEIKEASRAARLEP